MSYTGIETSPVNFSGFAAIPGTITTLTLVLVWSEYFSTDTESMTSSIQYSLDGGTTWTSVYSGPGNEFTTTQTTSVTLSTSADLTNLVVQFVPSVLFDPANLYFRMFQVFEVYVEAT